jgi:hypothetical protein
MWLISAVSLFIVITSCTLGVFLPDRIFADNLAQRIGMIGVALFSLPRFLLLLKTQTLTAVCIPLEAQLMGHVGMALYCLGTMWKIFRHRPRRRTERALT